MDVEAGTSTTTPQSFSTDRHAKKILTALNENRRLLRFCDGTVVLNGSKIPVQKNVLAAASHYFRLVFNYDDSTHTHTADPSIVDLTSLGIGEDTFATILDYIYTSNISLCDDNIQDILQASDLLLLIDLKALCCEYIEQCITPQNCIGIRAFSALYACPWVHHKASSYLDEHFRDISHCEEFLRLQTKDLREILKRDTLNVRSEEDIFNSILRWNKFDETNRKEDSKGIIRDCIRVKQLNKPYLQRNCPADPEFYTCLISTHDLSPERKEEDERCRGFTDVILAAGGEGPISIKQEDVEIKSCVRCLLPVFLDNKGEGVWIDLPSLIGRRTGHGVVDVGGCLYACGGRDQNCIILNTCEKYDPLVNKWCEIPRMNHGRVGFGLLAIDHNIYAIGGSNDMTEPLTSMEVYNIYTNKWSALPDMNLKRVWSSYCNVDKKIYVMAGGAVGKLFEAVECFDTRTETWTSVSPMREKRCDARAVAVGKDIYVLGGFRRIECPSAMHGGHNIKFCGTELYSTRNDYWAQLPTRGTGLCTMSDSSQVYGALYDGEEILVVGDLDMEGTFHCVRAYNIHTGMWHCISPNPPLNQRSYPVCLFRLPTYLLEQFQREQEKETFHLKTGSTLSI
ncbi:kelch-like protein 16 (gigaxonin) [Mytilus galloprovincialis]|uniref:Kelch-like protein 16 (Gigaxonin) n=1 Tax=Mytilus galloprovincialis TaxID=29158 RepID=A0A8B6E3J7_MYTGA|nr:kelch-like protein 16 (gigaxonin) [Mytilus galloprovincialis]